MSKLGINSTQHHSIKNKINSSSYQFSIEDSLQSKNKKSNDKIKAYFNNLLIDD